MPDLNGVEAARILRQELPALQRGLVPLNGPESDIG
jgi:hypothetical protein